MPRQPQQLDGRDDELIHADAYIESLLRRPMIPASTADLPTNDGLRRAIEALAGLPRFHPSFAFEESLAVRLRQAAAGPDAALAEVIPFPARPVATFAGIDRRLLLGGAIASGVSLVGAAGLAAYAWLRRDGREGRTA